MTPSATVAADGSVESTNVLPHSGDPSLAFPDGAPHGPPSFADKYEERKYLKHRLAIAFRIFAQFGFCEGVAGHITLRDPVDPESFWVNPFGMWDI
jgi:Class II Aldolase and Adducin N-terminal domain